MKKLNILLLFGIIALSAFLRLYLLNSVPPSPSLDEASIGWNAYSILQTGKDEYGKSFPILLRAYDDYRPALYAYFVIPFIKMFGLSAMAVRLPSAILSIISVLGTYLLVKEFFKKRVEFFTGEKIALLTSFLLAISPWHIYMSRLGHEVNLGLPFLIFATYFFLKKRIYLSAIFFLLSFISYQSEKVFIPLFLLGTFLIFRKEIISIKKQVIIASVMFLILVAPFLKATFEPNALIRLSGTNIFSASQARFTEQSNKLKEATEQKNLLGEVFFNRRILGAQLLTEGYLSHFNPVWLFTNPSQGQHKVPNLGLLYIWELPFILIGIYFLIRIKFDKKIKSLIFLWFLLAPLSAAFTTDNPHALRTLIFLPTWQIFTSIGILGSFFYLRKSKVFLYGLIVISASSLLYLYEQYFFTFPKDQSKSFQYSLSSAVPLVLANENSYKKVIFANHDGLFQSYMFFLFNSKYDPKIYQNQGGSISGGFSAEHRFGKYEFRNVRLESESGNNIYVLNYDEINSKVNVLKIFRELNGKPDIAVATK